ncbi:hypothetical protein HKX48_007543 [Thoreauomyces humboldtii]|nr:hypothetical protein HKX48_007543 [Thoreauomyces humboldtii]
MSITKLPSRLPLNAALVLIDVQNGFDDLTHWGGRRNNPEAEAQMQKLLLAWRSVDYPIIHVQHTSVDPNSPLRPGQSGCDIKDIVTPLRGEVIVTKTVNSAFIGTDLKQHLDGLAIRELVIAGLTTDHCVSTTTRMAGNYGFKVILVDDACATFDKVGPTGVRHTAEELHAAHICSLHGEFAEVLTTETVLGLL